MKTHLTIKEIPTLERPYEKFLKRGVAALSDVELLSIIIKTGTKTYNSLEIARELLMKRHKNLLNLYDYSYEELIQFKGIGMVKAIQLKAIAELSVRISATKRGYSIQMQSPSSIATYYMEQMRHLKQEILKVAFFDSKCNFLGDEVLSKGSVNYAYVSPKDIFRNALEKNAVIIILLHNHPSGDPAPSFDDKRITNRISECSKILDIEMADHIIIGDNSYFSFKEHNLI